MDPSEFDDKFWTGKCLSAQLMEDEPFQSPEVDPLLRHFRDFEQKFECLKYLGEGKQGIVLSAHINSVQYAIKVFYPFTILPDSRLNPEEQHLYFNPFSCECRAFARLQDMNEDGTFAVKCYGWVKLSSSQVNDIRALCKEKDFIPWALVKELVSTAAHPNQLTKMIENIDIAEQCNLFIPDVQPSNYGAGKFLDLGAAKVLPYHPVYWPGYCFTQSFTDHRNRLRKWTVNESKFIDKYED
ncbi:hypothetical protein A1O3_06027 [Capronia epimyces CBS 606.96]|uniref:Protein kinase domain-containing protein n=1 Tax=Capronia epimyces CBS 606.96 TaxID=1182542 RepID=W9YIU1_9EURO|nr:uncharacterized protein A1O3_06027 [Capronia epimyces CBS 606.96]EXJ82214.1 hypothetical protein A1O3_06027 [Capronia epimyces CBS 606.96]